MKRSVKSILVLLATAFLSSSAFAAIKFADDFESYPLYEGGDPVALGGDWLYFVNVFGAYPDCVDRWYGYAGDAPNGPQISNIVEGATGKALNTYSDYNNGNHSDGCLETNVFQERTVTAQDIGLYTFRFETQVPAPLGEDVDTYGFIKLLNPDNGYSLDLFKTISTVTEGEKIISVTLDASAVGKIVQWGFTNYASQYQPTGRYYDNVSFAVKGSGVYEGDLIGVPIPFWATLAIAGLLAFFGAAKLRSRKNTS